MKYFPLLYRLHAEDRYLIWISNEKDSIVVATDGLIPTFKDPMVLREYASLNHYDLQTKEPILHDLDWVAAWAASPAIPVDCNKALVAWNLFRDVAASIGVRGKAFEHLDSELHVIYDKLFWGNKSF